jgi:hypothetical protein
VAQRHRDHVDEARLIVDNEHAQPLGFLGHGDILLLKPGSLVSVGSEKCENLNPLVQGAGSGVLRRR